LITSGESGGPAGGEQLLFAHLLARCLLTACCCLYVPHQLSACSSTAHHLLTASSLHAQYMLTTCSCSGVWRMTARRAVLASWQPPPRKCSWSSWASHASASSKRCVCHSACYSHDRRRIRDCYHQTSYQHRLYVQHQQGLDTTASSVVRPVAWAVA
jgi:hypothetical protein